MTRRLEALADELARGGVDGERLRGLQGELDLVERPGAFARLSRRAAEVARRQWELALGEVEESRRMVAILASRAARLERLTPEEADEVRSQLADLLRMVPASLIAATNYTIPIPGSSLLTPVILRRLGLLPSRWREAYLLHALAAEAARLRSLGRADAAARVEALERELASEADAREAVERHAGVLTHWDANRNGVLDPDERDAYLRECARIRALAATDGHRRRWYLEEGGVVVGPVRLTELGPAGAELVCFDGRTGWVPRAALRAPEPPTGG